MPVSAPQTPPTLLEEVPEDVVIVGAPKRKLPVVWIMAVALGLVVAWAVFLGLRSLGRRTARDVSTAPTVVEAPPPTAPTPVPVPSRRPAPSPPVTSVRGEITVQTEPEGATVSLNGELRGVTPLTMKDLAVGAYKVRIEKDGYRTEERQIDVTREAAQNAIGLALVKAPRDAQPRPTRSTLNIDSKPGGASVMIDGRTVGKTPLTSEPVAAGRRRIRVLKDGFKPWELVLEFRAGQVMPVLATLEPLEGRSVAPARPAPPAVTVQEGQLVEKGAADVVNPRCIRCDPVAYPDVAKRLRLQGLVQVSFVVTESGVVEDIRVDESAGDILDQAVIDVVKNWRYEPATKKGVRVRVRETSRHRFRLGS